MASVTFSVPDEVKEAFDRTFRNGNKSAVIAELMRQAVAEAERKQRRVELFHRLTGLRTQRPKVGDRDVCRARTAGRA